MTESEFYEQNLKKGDFVFVHYTSGNKQVSKRIELKSEKLTPLKDTTYIDEKNGKQKGEYSPPEILYVGDNPNGNGIPLYLVNKIEK